MKKVSKFLSAVLLPSALIFTGCASGGAESSSSGDTNKEAAAEVVTMDVGFGPTIDMPYGQAHEHWAKILEEQSNGTMKLNVFPSDQLGSTKDTIDQVISGQPVITSTDVAPFADIGVKDLQILMGPYLFENWDQVEKVYESEWFDEQEKLLEEKNIKVLATNWRYGDRHTMTTTLVEKPEDIAGKKIRVVQAEAFIKGWDAIGATPTPMALGDVYPALQNGTIDGLENPVTTLYGNRYHEIAKFLLTDAHNKTINIVVCAKSFFDTLTPEQQELLIKTAEEAGDYQNELAAAKEEELIEEFKAAGVTVTEANYDEWKSTSESFYEEMGPNWTPGLYDRIQEIMNK